MASEMFDQNFELNLLTGQPPSSFISPNQEQDAVRSIGRLHVLPEELLLHDRFERARRVIAQWFDLDRDLPDIGSVCGDVNLLVVVNYIFSNYRIETAGAFIEARSRPELDFALLSLVLPS